MIVIFKQLLSDPTSFSHSDILTPEAESRFGSYFTNDSNGLCLDNVISDECLFRDYSRLGSRKVDFSRVRNPFTLSKFSISNYEKTWFIKDKSGSIEGPFNSYDMDSLFKKEKLNEDTLIGIQRGEFFTFRHFIEIVYPLPKVKQSYSEQNSCFKGLSLFPTETKLTKIVDESDRGSARSVSVERNKEDTPFKRTPFKNVLISTGEPTHGLTEHFVQTESRSKAFNSERKNEFMMRSNKAVNEKYLVRSSRHNANKHLTQSSNAQLRIEINDIIGNYTAIKVESDHRKYTELKTRLDFKEDHVREEDSEEDNHEGGDIDDFFDKVVVDKKK